MPRLFIVFLSFAMVTTAAVGFRIALVPEPVLDRVATRLNPEGNAIYNTAYHNLSFSPDGKWLAVGQGTGQVKILNTQHWMEHATIKAHENWAFSVLFSSEPDQLFTAGGDNLIQVWDLDALERPTKTLREHGMDVHGLALTPGNDKLVSAGDDRTPIVWNLASDSVERKLAQHPRQITSVAVDPNGLYVATGSRDAKVRMFSPASGELYFELDGHKADVMSVRFSPNGELLASASYDGTICIWDTDMGYLVTQRKAHDGAAICVDFSPDGKQIVSVDHQTLNFLDAENLKAKANVLRPELMESEQMSFVRFSPDGKQIAVTTTFARVLIIDAKNRSVLGSVKDLVKKNQLPKAPNIDGDKIGTDKTNKTS